MYIVNIYIYVCVYARSLTDGSPECIIVYCNNNKSYVVNDRENPTLPCKFRQFSLY